MGKQMTLVVEILAEVWGALGEMAPYLLFGFLMAGVLSAFISPDTVERHLGGRGIWPVFKASLFGVPLPLCSCGVIPVAASLRRHGSSKGATTAFLLSTPQTGVDSLLVTYSLLGPVFAVFRPVAAFVTGLVGGYLVDGVEARADAGEAAEVPACTDECCSDERAKNPFVHALRYGFVTLPRDIGRSMLVGLLAAGAIAALVPDDFFAGMLGVGIVGMLVMMAVGIPLYVCATASVPIAAALIAKGVSPGAAFVFLVTGPATNVAAVTTMWKVLGRRTTLLYLATVAVMALLSGMILDSLFTFSWAGQGHAGHFMLPGWVDAVGAVVLLAVLGVGLLPHRHAHGDHAERGDAEAAPATTFHVGGMRCSQCARSVRVALEECRGVQSADVDLDRGEATVTGRELDVESLAAAVTSLGYTFGRER